jgi:hypothetical protein
MKSINTRIVRALFAILVLVIPFTYSAQKSKKEDKKKEDKIEIQTKNLGSGAILENGNLRGYYVFQAVDKVYGKQQNYQIELYDENFTALNTLKYKAGIDIKIFSAAYSSEELCFMFLNMETRSFDYKVYNIEGKLISEYSSQLSKKDFKRYMKYVTAERLVSVEGGGFLSTSTVTEKRKISFKVSKFVKGQKKPIEYVFPADKKFNLPSILGVVDSTIVLSVRTSKSQLGPAKYYLLGLDQQSMKSKFSLNSDQDGENLFVPYSMADNPNFNTIKISGVFFKPSGNTNKHSKGLAMWELDSKGTLLKERYNAWDKDFDKALPFKNNGKAKKIGFLKVHEVFSTSEGKTYAISEGYRKRFNPWSIYWMINLMPMFMTKFQSTDLVLFQMDDEFSVQKADVFKKQRQNRCAYGFTTSGVHALANKMPYMFSYNYNQLNEEKNGFMFTYINDRFTGFSLRKRKPSFNTVKLENGKFSTDKFLYSGDQVYSRYMPNQFGKIATYDYSSKTKKSEFRIIKVK